MDICIDAGNRDVNKLRIQAALHPKVLASAPKVYWLRDPVLHGDAAQHSTVQGRLRWVSRLPLRAAPIYSVSSASYHHGTYAHTHNSDPQFDYGCIQGIRDAEG